MQQETLTSGSIVNLQTLLKSSNMQTTTMKMAVTFYIPYFKSKIDETSSMLDDLCNALYRCGYNIASSEKIVFD